MGLKKFVKNTFNSATQAASSVAQAPGNALNSVLGPELGLLAQLGTGTLLGSFAGKQLGRMQLGSSVTEAPQESPEEAERRKQNELYAQAGQYSGAVAGDPFKNIQTLLGLNPDAKFDDIKDPRMKMFFEMLSKRQESVRQAQLTPQLSQTRLSLVE